MSCSSSSSGRRMRPLPTRRPATAPIDSICPSIPARSGRNRRTERGSASPSPMERLASGFGLVEGPTIDPNGDLVFSDLQGGGVKRLGANGSVTDVIPHRRGIGGIAVHADGGFVISGRNVAWKRPDGETIVLL